MTTYTIYYTRNGETRSYTFVGTAAEKDAEIRTLRQKDGVTAVWFE